jgi:hypothetical protein
MNKKTNRNDARFLPEKVEIFPLCAEEGSSTDTINSELIYSMTESTTPISKKEFQKIIEAHNLFLSSGGVGGTWQTLLVSGLVLGIYFGVNAKEGEQAQFAGKILTDLDLKNKSLSFINGIGMICRKLNFLKSDLKNGLFTDSYFEGSCFEEANLSGCDFSRSRMTECSFKNADLSGADFENCDLTGSDFRGAILTGSRFPGAILNNILR